MAVGSDSVLFWDLLCFFASVEIYGTSYIPFVKQKINQFNYR
jgi:hypothetical protein